MEILKLIDLLEDKVEQSKSIPLLNRALVDKEDLLAAIEEIRLNIPEDMKQAKLIKDERKRILAEAQTRSETMIKNAEEKVVQMIDEHEITKQAVEQANQMVNDAQTKAMEIKTDCDQYADDILNDLEKRLDMLLRKVHDDKSYFESK